MRLDDGATFDGAAFAGTLAREALGVLGRKRDGMPIVDFARAKQVSRLWLSASGGPVNVRIGAQDAVDGSVAWSGTEVFTPSTDLYVDFDGIAGVAVAIEFSASVAFSIASYKLEIVPAGRFG